MIWLTLLKHIIPYIWDVFIKKYDEDGNPVLWSKTMIFGMLIAIIVIYYNLYSFIHTNTEIEHTLNIKNGKLIDDLTVQNKNLEDQLLIITAERDTLRHDNLRTKSQLSEARLDVIQLTNMAKKCENVKVTNPTFITEPQKTKVGRIDKPNKTDIEAILRGNSK